MKINDAEARRRLGSSKNLANLVPASPDFAIAKPAAQRVPSDSATINSTIPTQDSPRVSHETITRATRGNTIPEFIRDTMGSLRDSGVPARVVAAAFDVTPRSTNHAQTGKVGAKPANAERKAKILERQHNIQDQALLKLMESLNLIDTDKLEGASAKELSGIAVNLAKVSQLQSENANEAGQTNVIVYAPQLRDEKRFKVIEVDH